MAHKHVDNAFHFNIMNKLMYDQYIFNQHIPLTKVKFSDFIYHMLDIEYYLNIMEYLNVLVFLLIIVDEFDGLIVFVFIVS